MRLNFEEIALANVNVRAWLNSVQGACRGANAPVFKIAGPCVLNVRTRSRLAPTVQRRFVGGEGFRLESLHGVERLEEGFIDITVIMAPSDFNLIGGMHQIQMPLMDAYGHFAGMQDFVENMLVPNDINKPARTVWKVTEQDRQSNPSWGCW